jgi:hypothetical protein
MARAKKNRRALGLLTWAEMAAELGLPVRAVKAMADQFVIVKSKSRE